MLSSQYKPWLCLRCKQMIDNSCLISTTTSNWILLTCSSLRTRLRWSSHSLSRPWTCSKTLPICRKSLAKAQVPTRSSNRPCQVAILDITVIFCALTKSRLVISQASTSDNRNTDHRLVSSKKRYRIIGIKTTSSSLTSRTTTSSRPHNLKIRSHPDVCNPAWPSSTNRLPQTCKTHNNNNKTRCIIQIGSTREWCSRPSCRLRKW